MAYLYNINSRRAAIRQGLSSAIKHGHDPKYSHMSEDYLIYKCSQCDLQAEIKYSKYIPMCTVYGDMIHYDCSHSKQ